MQRPLERQTVVQSEVANTVKSSKLSKRKIEVALERTIIMNSLFDLVVMPP